MSPLTSGDLFSPFISELTLNKESSLVMNFSLPPCAAARPLTSCGTKNECCQALPSVYMAFCSSCSERYGSNGVTQLPSLFFARMKPVAGSNKFFQEAERLMNVE